VFEIFSRYLVVVNYQNMERAGREEFNMRFSAISAFSAVSAVKRRMIGFHPC
jgi:hypothetical protein